MKIAPVENDRRDFCMFFWALRQIGLMSNICQVIIRLPGFFILFSIIHFLSLFCDYQEALRLLLLPVFHLDIVYWSLIF